MALFTEHKWPFRAAFFPVMASKGGPQPHGSNEGIVARDFSVRVRLNASCVHACRPVEEVIAVSCVSDSSRAGRVPAAVVRVKLVLLQADGPLKGGPTAAFSVLLSCTV